MDPSRYRRAHDVFGAAVRLPRHEVRAFVAQACGGDAEVEQLVLQLIEMDSRLDDPSDTDPAPDDPVRIHGLAEAFAPKVVGAYSVLDVLGVGSSGVVLRARQELVGRDVALKLLHTEHTEGSLPRRFAVEAHLLGMLDHPGIVRIIDSGTLATGSGSRPYLVMDLVEGRPITEHCVDADLGPRQALALLADVADAVQHAHQRGIIHRDLKPANIIVTPEGLPRILDFGIARSLEGGLGETVLDGGPQAVLGTVGYMSPEQLRGEVRAVDMRSDVYALGAIARELIGACGRASAGASPGDAPSSHAPRERLVGSGSEDLDAVVQRALREDKTQRYASAADFATDLRNALADRPISARRANAFDVWRRTLRRYRVAVSLLAGLGLSLTVALVLQARAAQLSRLATERSQIAAERSERVLEGLFVMLSDSVLAADGRIIPAGDATIRDWVRTADVFVQDFGADDPAAQGSLLTFAGRILSTVGHDADDPETALRFTRQGLERIQQVLPADDYHTLRARRDLIQRLQADGDGEAAVAHLRQLWADASAWSPHDRKLRRQLVSRAASLKLDELDGVPILDLLRDVITEAEAVYGAEHRYVMSWRIQLAEMLDTEAGLAELERLRPLITERGRARGQIRVDRSISRRLLKRGLDTDSLPDCLAAYELREQALALARTHLGAEASATKSLARQTDDLAELLARRGADPR